jgi:cysteine desulfurase / selenocysteine lyase
MVGVAALWAGQDWLDANGVEAVHAREMRLAQQLVDGLCQVDGVRLYCCERLQNHLSTVSMNLERLEAAEVGVMLDVDHGIATRTGLHCAPLVHQQLGTVDIHGSVRFSIGAFNTEEQVDTAIHAVAEIASWAKERNARKVAVLTT